LVVDEREGKNVEKWGKKIIGKKKQGGSRELSASCPKRLPNRKRYLGGEEKNCVSRRSSRRVFESHFIDLITGTASRRTQVCAGGSNLGLDRGGKV